VGVGLELLSRKRQLQQQYVYSILLTCSSCFTHSRRCYRYFLQCLFLDDVPRCNARVLQAGKVIGPPHQIDEPRQEALIASINLAGTHSNVHERTTSILRTRKHILLHGQLARLIATGTSLLILNLQSIDHNRNDVHHNPTQTHKATPHRQQVGNMIRQNIKRKHQQSNQI
jgi:hypothetical protein